MPPHKRSITAITIYPGCAEVNVVTSSGSHKSDRRTIWRLDELGNALSAQLQVPVTIREEEFSPPADGVLIICPPEVLPEISGSGWSGLSRVLLINELPQYAVRKAEQLGLAGSIDVQQYDQWLSQAPSPCAFSGRKDVGVELGAKLAPPNPLWFSDHYARLTCTDGRQLPCFLAEYLEIYAERCLESVGADGLAHWSRESVGMSTDVGSLGGARTAPADGERGRDSSMPVRIGRFTVLQKLGAGGMGVVYAAYDEQLDRRLAVKLLHDARSSEARIRFEAQAMARLSHPHVVAIYEVGIHEGDIFVAMELVEGRDLRAWLAREPKHWREIVEMFRQAGEGLIAAHAAGIVHRDFKPDNVLVGEDGRARVADFGLAHGPGGALELPPLAPMIMRTGKVVGTPAYMSPEQAVGHATDARTDQFSFCVALWEGLYGQRPFVGRSWLQVMNAIYAGRIEPPPPNSKVPKRLQAILMRGLARDPDDRWPSMRALLDAIADDPRVRQRRIAMRVAAALVGIVMIGASYRMLAELRHGERTRDGTALTDRLELEHARDLARARDATRMLAARQLAHEDPAAAVALLREVEGEERHGSDWLSLANTTLGRPLSAMVLRGHRAPIGPLLFAPDDTYLYSGADDGEVRRWQLERGTSEVIVNHAGAVTELALSSDGEWLASSSRDGTVWLWSSTSARAHELSRSGQGVASVVFDRSARRLALACEDGTIEVHDLASGEQHEVRIDAAIRAVDFDPTGTQVLFGANDRRAGIWPVGAKQPGHTLTGHTASVSHVRWLSAQRVLTAADDGTARLWQLDVDTRRSQVVAVHERPISAIDVRGSKLVTAALDGSMRVGSLESPYASHELPRHDAAVQSARFDADATMVVSASFDETARRTRADGRVSPEVLAGHQAPVHRAVLDRSGRYLATSSRDAEIRIWDIQRPALQAALPGHAASVCSVEVDAAGERAVTASHDGSARVWDLRDGAALTLLEHDELVLAAGTRALNHAVFSPNGDRVAAARSNGDVVLWQLDPLAAKRLEGHASPALRVVFDHQGKRIASASQDTTARVWDVESGAPLMRAEGHQDQLSAVFFDASDRRLVTASWDATVRVWDVQTGDALALLRGHTARINRAVESPDRRSWATCSDDGSARLWPADLVGDPLVLDGHGTPVGSIVFEPSGQRVATVARDGFVRVWSVRDGQLLDMLGGGRGALSDAVFIEGNRLVTAMSDGSLWIWSLDASRTPPLVLQGHATHIQSTAVGVDGHRLVSAADDGTVQLWRLELLGSAEDSLDEQLWAATRSCLTVEQRQRDLREAPDTARTAYEACATHWGR